MGLYYYSAPPWLVQFAVDMGCRRAIATRAPSAHVALTFASSLGHCTTIDHSDAASASVEVMLPDGAAVDCVVGDPDRVLARINWDDTASTLIWFSGHHDTADLIDVDRCPILDQLNAIGPGLAGRHIVAIDDARLFGFPIDRDPLVPYYPRLVDVLNVVESLGLVTFVVDDVIIGVPAAMQVEFRSLAHDDTVRQRVHLAGAWPGVAVLAAGTSVTPTWSQRLGRRMRSRSPLRRVYVRLIGGVGNQLFQYATALSIARGRPVRALRGLDDGEHSIGIEAFLPGELRTASRWWSSLVSDAMDGGVGGWSALHEYIRTQMVRTHGSVTVAYRPAEKSSGDARILDGAFQHPTWFEPGADAVVEQLLQHRPAGWAPIPGLAALSLRRGDYVDLGWTLPEDYYHRCLEELDSSVPIVVVGDDPAAVDAWRNRLCAGGRSVVDAPRFAERPAINDFWTIAAAAHVIMSNSTFCWWAVRVGDESSRRASSTRVVWAPAEWVLGVGRVLVRDTWRGMPSLS